MIPYLLSSIISVLIGIFFFKIRLKQDIQNLLSSYSNSSKLMLGPNNDNDLQQEAMFKELKSQFSLLFKLLLKLLLILSPLLIIIAYTSLLKKPIDPFLDYLSIIISLVSFILVYLFIRYAKPQ